MTGKLEAAEALAERVTEALFDNAERFSCGEADTIAEFLDAFGCDGDAFLAHHSTGDDEGDDHIPEFDDQGFVMGHRRRAH